MFSMFLLVTFKSLHIPSRIAFLADSSLGVPPFSPFTPWQIPSALPMDDKILSNILAISLALHKIQRNCLHRSLLWPKQSASLSYPIQIGCLLADSVRILCSSSSHGECASSLRTRRVRRKFPGRGFPKYLLIFLSLTLGSKKKTT